MLTIAFIVLLAILGALVALVASGIYFGDALAPRGGGRSSAALTPRRSETALDRAVTPLLAARPGHSCAVLLDQGADAFGARALSTRHAGRSLDLQYYSWSDDSVGRMLAGEALAAAERGVRVRILLDDINNAGRDRTLLALDAHPRIEIRIHNPLSARSGLGRLLELVQRVYAVNHRMHNKCWIADGRIAIVGGRNIGAEYFDANESRNFRDLDLMIAGPAVEQASRIFDAYWNCGGMIPIADLSAETALTRQELQALLVEADTRTEGLYDMDALERAPKLGLFHGDDSAAHWCAQLEILADPPQKWRRRADPSWLVFRLTEPIRQASKEALFSSPYFVPRRRFLRVLKSAVARGADVAVVTNTLAATDVTAVHGGYMRYRGRLLRGGVRLFELRAGAAVRGPQGVFGSSGASLHTKAFVLDGEVGFVGSFNLDPRSARLNTEMGVLFAEPTLACELRAYWALLASPALSFTVRRGANGGLRWTDAAADPPVTLKTEPQSTLRQRMIAQACRFLPIEAVL